MEVLSELPYKINPEEIRTELSFTQKIKAGGFLVELASTTTKRDTFCEAVRRVLGEKVLVSSLESICSLEIRDFNL